MKIGNAMAGMQAIWVNSGILYVNVIGLAVYKNPEGNQYN
jgi:hypothetical protein